MLFLKWTELLFSSIIYGFQDGNEVTILNHITYDTHLTTRTRANRCCSVL